MSDQHQSTAQGTDVLIIGGGPAGTTIGSFLAMKHHRVTLLEKDQHPRFHIGESLLPMSLPIMERLGVANAVREIGVHKPGADFTPDIPGAQHYTIRFERALGDSPSHAWEVTRSEFDALLFDNCVHHGVDARQNHQVTRVSLDTDGNHLVESVDEDGERHCWRPRYLIDASGRDSFLAKKERWQTKNPGHASAALFGHFTNVPRRAGDDAGNISVYWFDEGWIWMIPLRDGVMSVGCVCWPEYLKTRKTDPESFIRQTVARSPAAGERFKDAQCISEVRVTGNYSYSASRMTGNGYALVGDAFAFIDPVFSSGVYLAMNSAESLVPSVECWLAGDRKAYTKHVRHYERRIRRGLKRFSWFIYRFTTPTMKNLFSNPRNTFEVEQAIISVLAGDVFTDGKIPGRIAVFKGIYFMFWLKQLRASATAWRNRKRNVNTRFTEENLL